MRDVLKRHQKRLVLAESCTAGRVAATLAVVPGISEWLCGSFVVYRNDSKAQWLGIPTDLLDDPQIGPVSSQVTKLLCQRALDHTPEADVAVAVTGHIGPGCPSELDGKVFVCCLVRHGLALRELAHQLSAPAPRDAGDLAGREARLNEATRIVLQWIEVSAAN